MNETLAICVAAFGLGAILCVGWAIFTHFKNLVKGKPTEKKSDIDVKESYDALDPMNATFDINRVSEYKNEEIPLAVEIVEKKEETVSLEYPDIDKDYPKVAASLAEAGNCKFDLLVEPVKNPDCSYVNLRRLREAHRDSSLCPNPPDFFRPTNEGIYKIRLLPAAWQANPYLYNTKTHFVARRQHYLSGVGSSFPTVVQCSKQYGGQVMDNWTKQTKASWHGECPICDHWKHLWAQIDIAQKKGEYKDAQKLQERAKICKPTERYYYNVLVLVENGEKVRKGPMIWSAGKMVHEQITRMTDKKYMNEMGEDPYDLLDIKKGYSITLRVMKKGAVYGGHGYPSYDVTASYKPVPIGDDNAEIERVMANLWDLELVANKWTKSKEELEAAMQKCGFVEARRCCQCNERLSRHATAKEIFCSKKCLNNHLRTKHGCPKCGTATTKTTGSLHTYSCGYAAGFQGVVAKCSNAPDCECRVRGCECDKPHEWVDNVGETTKKKGQEDMDADFLNDLRKMDV